MSEKQRIEDQGSAWKYFHIMLNMDDDDLDPHQYRLLGHYRRQCGANGGTCVETIKESAQRTGMGEAKLREARKQLVELKRIALKETLGGVTEVTVLDQMAENIKRYTSAKNDTPVKNERGTPSQKQQGGPVKSKRGPVSKMTGNRNNSIQQQHRSAAGAADGRFKARKFYAVNDGQCVVYSKSYEKAEAATLVDAWQKHGIKAVRGDILNSDPKYAAYKVVDTPRPRKPLFDALAECCWNMPRGFDSDLLGKNGGRVGRLERELLAALKLEAPTSQEIAALAKEVREAHRRWKNAFPKLAFNRELTAFLSWLLWCRDHTESEDQQFFNQENDNDQDDTAEYVEVSPGVYEER